MAIFDITYVGDMPYLKLEGGTVTGATTFTNNIAASTINGVTVGSDPKFTDTTYSVATTSANGLLPALGGGTTNYLRADGSWAKPPGTTYSVATTSANGLMAAADKTAVNKIGSGTLNTTNKTIIPAINELAAKGSVDSSGDGWIRFTDGTQICYEYFHITSQSGNFWTYPKEFTEAPVLLGSFRTKYTSEVGFVINVRFGAPNNDPTAIKALVVIDIIGGVTVTTNTSTGYVYLLAIGKWK